MLVIDRLRNTGVCIGEHIRIRVLRTGANRVRLGIEAPRSIPVFREELKPKAPDLGATTEREQPFRVLVVEDDPSHAALIGLVIQERLSTCLTVATSGSEALRLLSPEREASAARPNLVLLDLNLPDMPGLTVLEAIKTTQALRALPVVVFSGLERAETARQSLDLGANAYVPKSTSFDEFSQRVVRIVDFWSQVGRVA
ncbi:MAG: response regulator [Phycisphaerae bacterium]|jgi:carbon storage regulator CsrA|nr:response regulator [Planctomycetia bacterium]MCK6463480.1 response regulator [Phycisphaerae bacterium]MCL4717103.1 response regulator [Phycisphaerae bacterium]NUQ08617.1 response regulator [Phycisphaerae bacterium]